MPQKKKYDGCTHPDCHYDHKTPCTSRQGGKCPENIYELMDTLLEEEPDEEDEGADTDAAPDFSALEVPRNVAGFDNLSFLEWTPPPKSYSQDLINEKREVLAAFCRDRDLRVLSEEIKFDASRYPYVTINTRVDAWVKGFKSGVILNINIRADDNKIYVSGKPQSVSWEDERNSIYIGDSFIISVDFCGNSIKYPVSGHLSGAYIKHGGIIPWRGLPMEDAVLLCGAYKKYIQVRSMNALNAMLKSAKAMQNSTFGF